jgi:hypothetical protein
MGGLGNQMFQISHALCQSWKYGVESSFRPISFIPSEGSQPIKYLDNIFRKIKFENTYQKFYRIYEGSWNHSEINPTFDKSIEFYGYFQSSKNFLGYDNEVRNLFKPTESFIEKILKNYPSLQDEQSTSIHIRRGDYLNSPNVHPTIDVSYINHCLSLIDKTKKIFIFSNDKDWVNQNLNIQSATLVDGLDDYEELWMMSLCKNMILSNSSFSWWSAFLNQNFDCKIFAPSLWFGPQGPNPHNNIYEKNWNIIPVIFKNGKLTLS